MRPGVTISLAALFEIAGAGGIFIGAYVPWVVTFALISSVPVRGVDTTYGRILPLIPLAVLGLVAWGWYIRRARWVHLLIIVFGLATLGMTTAYVLRVKGNLARAQQSLARSGLALPGTVSVRSDVGLYLTLAGATAMVVGGLLGAREDRAEGGPPA